jgi:hypothetical protein
VFCSCGSGWRIDALVGLLALCAAQEVIILQHDRVAGFGLVQVITAVLALIAWAAMLNLLIPGVFVAHAAVVL